MKTSHKSDELKKKLKGGSTNRVPMTLTSEMKGSILDVLTFFIMEIVY